jgi:cation transport ATPase
MIPLDGKLFQAKPQVDEAAITGEPIPQKTNTRAIICLQEHSTKMVL